MVTLLVVMLLAGAVARSLVGAIRQTRRAGEELQALWLAEAAVERGLAAYRANADYTGETWRPSITAEQTGVAEIRIERRADVPAARLVVTANYPDDPWQRVSVTRELVLPPVEAAP